MGYIAIIYDKSFMLKSPLFVKIQLQQQQNTKYKPRPFVKSLLSSLNHYESFNSKRHMKT